MRSAKQKLKRINRLITKTNYSAFGAGAGAGGVDVVFNFAESVL